MTHTADLDHAIAALLREHQTDYVIFYKPDPIQDGQPIQYRASIWNVSDCRIGLGETPAEAFAAALATKPRPVSGGALRGVS